MSPTSSINVQVSINSKGEYYIRNNAAIDAVIHNVRAFHYSTILGPHYREKSLLLRDIKDELEATGDEFCILIDLLEHRSVIDSSFLKTFGEIVYRRIKEKRKDIALHPAVTDELSLQHFLQDCVKRLKLDLVLIIDHLEVIRIGPLDSLLKALRAVYNTSSVSDDPHRLVAVTASSLSVAEMSLGPTSPFNIARLIWVHDLTFTESKDLALATLKKAGVGVTQAGLERLLRATTGDRYLIRSICMYCAKAAIEEKRKEITEEDVNAAIVSILNEEKNPPAPLREAVRELENNPVRLMNVLMILNQGMVHRRNLRLDVHADVNDLELYGAIRLEEVEGETVCRIRNEIYEGYLKKHFHPERIVHVLRMHGQWDEAIKYLKELIPSSLEYKPILLGTIVDSIFAAKTEQEAYGGLAQHLRLAFNISQAAFYFVNPERSLLTLVSHDGFERKPNNTLPLTEKNRGEVQAFFAQYYQVSQGNSGEQLIYVPLVRDDSERLGLAIIHDVDADPLRDEFLELLAFLKQVGRAVGNVIDRERKLMQLTVLHETGKRVTSSLDPKQVMKTIVKAAIDAIPGAQRGSLLYWDEDEQKLIIGAAEGYRPTVKEEIKMGKGEGYVGKVYATGIAIRMDNVLSDPRTLLKKDPDIKKQKSAICVPLKAQNRIIGILCLDNTTAYGAFTDNDMDLLSTFATQAAIAIQNARLYTELYDLGININRGNRDIKDIFLQTIKSITRVSGAKAANMLLLRDTDDPQLSVSQKPIMSVSQGLGEDYDERIKPRQRGLTFHVLQDRKPYWAKDCNSNLGINGLSQEKGTRAYLCLPLMIQNSIIGVLFVHYDKPHDFPDIEVNVLSLFANQAALAIENVRQRDELVMTKAVAWMGIVFSSVAHRISQKAGAIRNTVWRLRQILDPGIEIKQRLDRIDECAQMVGEIPGRALLPVQDQIEPLDINSVVGNEVSRWCQHEENLIVDFNMRTNNRVTVFADPKWLAIVLEMIVTNAIRAMRDVEYKKLSVLSEIRGNRVVVEITNSGKEIPEHVRRHLFKEPIPKRQGAEGSGVGLLIARTIMHRYGGDLELSRTSSESTTFSLWFPLDTTSLNT